MFAIVVTLLGIVSSIAIGVGAFHWSWGESLWAILTSNVALWIGLVATVVLQSPPGHGGPRRGLRHILHGWWRIWGFFLVTVFSIILGLNEKLRDPIALAVLFVPLASASGIAVFLFGPLQDWRMGRYKRRNSLQRPAPRGPHGIPSN